MKYLVIQPGSRVMACSILSKLSALIKRVHHERTTVAQCQLNRPVPCQSRSLPAPLK